jgi:hypothetical protein
VFREQPWSGKCARRAERRLIALHADRCAHPRIVPHVVFVFDRHGLLPVVRSGRVDVDFVPPVNAGWPPCDRLADALFAYPTRLIDIGNTHFGNCALIFVQNRNLVAKSGVEAVFVAEVACCRRHFPEFNTRRIQHIPNRRRTVRGTGRTGHEEAY